MGEHGVDCRGVGLTEGTLAQAAGQRQVINCSLDPQLGAEIYLNVTLYIPVTTSKKIIVKK